MGEPTQNLDREGTARGRFIDIFREKADLLSFMTAFTDETQALENALFQLFQGFNINTAEGVQLDAIGEIVGLDRDGATDTSYRIRIRARILLNISSGTPNELLRLVNLLLPPTATATYQPFYPASFVITANGTLTETEAAEISAAIIEGAPAGVLAQFLYSLFDDDETFTFASADALEDDDQRGYSGAEMVEENRSEDLSLESTGVLDKNLFAIQADGVGTWVAMNNDGTVRTSIDDGETWTSITLPDADAGQSDPSYLFRANEKFWAVYYGTTPSEVRISYSTDGLIWTLSTTTFSNIDAVIGIVGDGSNVLYVNDGAAWLSTNGGVTFTDENPSSADLSAVAYNAAEGTFLLGDADSDVWSSADGASWASDATGLAAAIVWLTCSTDGTTLAATAAGDISVSPDGASSWVTDSSPSGTQAEHVVFAYELFWWVGDGDVYTSPDSVTWTFSSTRGVAKAFLPLTQSLEPVMTVVNIDTNRLDATGDFGVEWFNTTLPTAPSDIVGLGTDGRRVALVFNDGAEGYVRFYDTTGGVYAGALSNG